MAKNKSCRQNLLPLLFMGLLVLIFFHKLVLNPTYMFWPSEDIVAQSLLYEGLVRDSFNSLGQFPLWNNLFFSGVPFFGNPVIPFYYPLNLIMLILSKGIFYGYAVIFHTILAAVATYMLARELSLPKNGAFISAIAFSFSSAIIGKVYPGHVVNLAVISLTPLVFLMLEKLMKSGDIKHSLLLGVVWALQLLAGQLHFFFFSSLALLFYFLFRLLFVYHETRSVGRVSKTVLYTAVSLLICLLLSAFFLLPTYSISKTTIRAGGLDYETATQFSLPPRQAITFLIPNFFGSIADQTYWGEWANSWSLQAYTGIIPLVLAAIASLFLIKNRKEIWFFLLLSVFSVLFSFGRYTPFYKFFYLYLPGISSFRIPAEQLFLFCFSIAMLAGYGASFLLTTSHKELKKRLSNFTKLLWVAAIISLCLAIAVFALKPAIIDYGMKTAEQRYQQLHPGGQDFEQNYLPKIEMVYSHIAYGALMFAGLLALSTSVIWLASNTRLRKSLLFLLFVILILIDLWAYGLPQIEVRDPAELYKRDELIEFLQNDTSYYRIYNLAGFVQQHQLAEFGIETITGRDPLILRDYVKFTNLLGNLEGEMISSLPLTELEAEEITNQKILDLLNVKYIITSERVNLPGFILVYEKQDFIEERKLDKFKEYSNSTLDLYIYQNLDMLPRTYLIGTAKSVSNRSDILRELASEDFNPQEYILIEKALPLGHSNIAISQEVDIGYYSPNRIALNITLDRPMFLVLSEIYYPGWKAYDNGKETELYRTDYLLRSVWMDKGMHQIEFIYEPVPLKQGLIISLTTLVAIIIIFTLIGLTRRNH